MPTKLAPVPARLAGWLVTSPAAFLAAALLDIAAYALRARRRRWRRSRISRR